MPPLSDERAEEYAQKIRDIVNQLKKTSKNAIVENETYKVSPEEAKAKYGGRIGETFYRFPNQAASQEIIDAYESVKPYCGTGPDAVSFEMHLSHRGMTVMFVDGDLVIRKDRNLFIDRLTEEKLRERIKYAKEHYVIDWDKAKIFIFPYKTIYFYISDSFEETLGGGRSDLRNPKNWFTIPLTEDFDYSTIRRECREFATEHPLQGEKPMAVELNITEVLPRIIDKQESRIHADTTNQEPVTIKKSGCMVVICLLLINTLLLFLL